MSRFRLLENVPAWRTMALHAWGRPSDPSVYGIIDVSIGAAQEHITRVREQSGSKVTLTHMVGKAVALAIAERPEINAIIRRGRLWVRDSIDIFFQVAFEGGENLAGAKVRDCDKKSVVEIANDLAKRAARIREEKDHPTQKSASMLSRLPPSLIKLAMRAGETLSYDFGLNLSKAGVPYDAFGSCMVTNVGGFGLTVGHAPLFPPSRVPIVLTIGAVHDAAVVREGKVVVEPTLTIGASFDHRLLDGFQAGRMAKRFREVLENPDKELG